MGRRATKKVETNGETTLHQRYLYRGYLQIAACDLTAEGTPNIWHILWDPTQLVATRPLAICKDGTWYTYGWDLTKNICELFNNEGSVVTSYNYSPYGEVTANGDITQPLQWSSEFNDTELGLIYYNYRHYNPVNGRWLGRDIIPEVYQLSLYEYLHNNICLTDYLGMHDSWFMQALKNKSEGTVELNSPIPIWGGYPFIAVTITRISYKEAHIAMSIGIAWSLSLFLKKIPMPDRFREFLNFVSLSVFLEGEGRITCDCIELCKLSGNVAVSLGNGRRGSSAKVQNNGMLDGGVSAEGKVQLDVCNGEISGQITLVASLGIKSDINLLGYKYEANISYDYVQDFDLGNMSSDSLKLITPCKGA